MRICRPHELIDALHNQRPIPESYLNAQGEFRSGGSRSRRGSWDWGSRSILPGIRQDFAVTLDRWLAKHGERPLLMEALDEKRRLYEQRLIDLEFDTARAVIANGEARLDCERIRRCFHAFEVAEERCEEIRGPYEQSIQPAQQNYEAKRQEYLRMVEEIREQLDKAPDEYRQRFDEILTRYNDLCARKKMKSHRRRWFAYFGHGTS